MQGKMKAYLAEADWAPKPEYTLNEREIKEHRAMRADFVYKNGNRYQLIRPGFNDSTWETGVVSM